MRLGLEKNGKKTRLTCVGHSEGTTPIFTKLSGPYGEVTISIPGGLWTPSGLFDSPLRKGNSIKTLAQQIEAAYHGCHKLYRESLTLYGIGYKAYAPKIFKRSSLVLRAGFGAAELRVRGRKSLKLRARKQRVLLVSPVKQHLSTLRGNLILLKRTNPYTGKGIRTTGSSYRQKQGKVRVR